MKRIFSTIFVSIFICTQVFASAKVATVYNNFSRGKLDHDLNGRYDLPIYTTGADIFKNFITNFKGNAIYRPGFENILEFQDCRFVDFKFSDQQDYLALFYENKIKFLSYDSGGGIGLVQSGGSDLEVTTTYSLADAKELSYDQNADVMYITHEDYEPRKLTRTSATSFTFTTFERTEDRFADPTTTVNDTSSTSVTMDSGELTFTVSSSMGYLEYQPITITYDASNYMTGTVTSYSGTTLVVDINNIVGSGTYSSWTISMTTVGWPSCVRFYEGRLWYGGPSGAKTYVYGSVAGIYDDFTVPDTDIQDDDAIVFSVADLAEQIKWIMGGSNSLILGSSQALVAVNGGTTDDAITPTTVSATITNTDGSNDTQPIRKDVLLFYINALRRNVDYFSYDLLSESFKAEDANFASYDITLGGIKRLVFVKNRNDLIYTLRDDGVLLALNFNQAEKIVGWTEIETDGEVLDIGKLYNPNTEQDDLFILVSRDNGVFIERMANEVNFALKDDFFTDEDSADDDEEAYSRYTAEQLKSCIYLDNATVYNNLYDSTLTFDGTDTITSTASDFSSGDVGNEIHYKTVTGVEKGVFEITGYTSATEVTVDVLTTPSANTYSSWYKSFSSVSGLTDYASMEVSVVADGGYLGEYDISAGGVLTLDREVTSIVVGLKYDGLIKMFNLGFSSQGVETQTKVKNVNKAKVRLVHSAGGLIGTSLYSMEEIQEFDPAGYYDLPPLPIDGDSREINFDDKYSEEKSIYIKQDKPLPFHITSVFCDVNYGT